MRFVLNTSDWHVTSEGTNVTTSPQQQTRCSEDLGPHFDLEYVHGAIKCENYALEYWRTGNSQKNLR